MSFLKKLFGEKSKKQEIPDFMTLASLAATSIDDAIQANGLQVIFRPNTAIVLSRFNGVGLQWTPNLEINDHVRSFVYLSDFEELTSNIEKAFGLDMAKLLPPDKALEMIKMMASSTVAQQAIDQLAYALASKLRTKVGLPPGL
ncbi:MAG: hypothetical protein RBS57_07730 [Desulforhabdus sp.]|jgi:hypothetical protein|nr:hypothetical protein [Desulforhabdus sp.]